MTGHQPEWSHAITLEAAPKSASRARAFVSSHLLDHQLPDLVDPVELVASELATNAVVHAQTAFSVTLTNVDGIVLLTVRDGSTSLPVRRTGDLMSGGGRGLHIVDIMSLKWGYLPNDAGAKTIWASFSTT
jgi:anti-sigma regulatory factor (Ser/Thr protein kinase)